MEEKKNLGPLPFSQPQPNPVAQTRLSPRGPNSFCAGPAAHPAQHRRSSQRGPNPSLPFPGPVLFPSRAWPKTPLHRTARRRSPASLASAPRERSSPRCHHGPTSQLFPFRDAPAERPSRDVRRDSRNLPSRARLRDLRRCPFKPSRDPLVP